MIFAVILKDFISLRCSSFARQISFVNKFRMSQFPRTSDGWMNENIADPFFIGEAHPGVVPSRVDSHLKFTQLPPPPFYPYFHQLPPQAPQPSVPVPTPLSNSMNEVTFGSSETPTTSAPSTGKNAGDKGKSTHCMKSAIF